MESLYEYIVGSPQFRKKLQERQKLKSKQKYVH